MMFIQYYPREILASDVTLLECIGSGSFGVVYRGKWRSSIVAIKKVCIASELDRSALAQELSLSSQVGNHPYVLPFIGACTSIPTHFLLLSKYCELGSIYDYVMVRKVELSQQQRTCFFAQSASALQHLHTLNIIHRDVTSRNFLLGDPFHLYLADFSISRLLRKALTSSATTSELGPIRWLSPESLFGGVYSFKTDVYMYANFLYELLFLRVPFFELSNLFDVSDAIHEGRRPTLPSSIPAHLLKFFEACWSTNPSDRYDMSTIVKLFESPDLFDNHPVLSSASDHYEKISEISNIT